MQAQNQTEYDTEYLTQRPANALAGKITFPLRERAQFYEMHTTVKPEFTPLLRKCLSRYRGYALDLFPGFDTNPHLAKYMVLMYEEDYKWYGMLRGDELPDDEDRMIINSICANKSPDAIDLMCKYPHLVDDPLIISINKSPIIANILDRQQTLYGSHLSSNPAAANYLVNRVKKICWYNLSANPSDYAIDLLEAYPENINYQMLCNNTNPRAIEILKKNIDKIDWIALSGNESAISILREHINEIFWGEFAYIQHPEAIRIIERELPRLDWDMVSVPLGGNPAAVPILRKHPDWIDWNTFCVTANTPESIQFIRENLHMADWDALSANEHALPILREFPDRIQQSAFMSQDMFDYNYTYEYSAILKARYKLHQEYHAWAGHPSRMELWKGWRINDFIDNEDAEEASF